MTHYYRCRCGSVQVWTYREKLPDVTCSACGTAPVQSDAPLNRVTDAERATVETMREIMR